MDHLAVHARVHSRCHNGQSSTVCAASKELSKPCHDHMCGDQLIREGRGKFERASSSSTQTCRAWNYKYKNMQILDSLNGGCDWFIWILVTNDTNEAPLKGIHDG